MQPSLLDNHGRPITYVRLAVTDRCNLRCFYCMPAEGIDYLPRPHLLSYEEMERLIGLLAQHGISKVRITGGEPFVRKDMIDFLARVKAIPGVEQLTLTTNGVLTAPLLPRLKQIGISSVNLSLDTLDRERFHHITRRDELPKAMDCLHALIEHGIDTKINAVIMDGKNTDDILPLAEFTREHPVGVRYIEEMPFNGTGSHYPHLHWNHRRILDTLKAAYPSLQKLTDGPHSTSSNYQIPGYQGTVGIIAAFSRTFCGTCNRIRVTPQGMLKTCLYDDGVFNLRDLMRQGKSDQAVMDAVKRALGNRARDGYQAEQRRQAQAPVSESMSTIGG
jgi:molybdenum cofactor biosynthesis protein A